VKYLDHPYDIAADGTTAGADPDDHLRDLIEQILFTAPGERVNRPEFGSGIRRLVFEPNSEVLAAALQSNVQASLQQYLADRIQLEGVQVESEDAALRVTVTYRPRRDGRQRTASFEWGV
jgi:hypothetical protein